MSLLINIADLLVGQKVESNRIEFKEGWNPSAILRTICAFANDFDNAGSGYVLIGVKEVNGIAQRPVGGVPENQLDIIQQELQRFCQLIQPTYHPRISIEEVDAKLIIAIWAPAGSNRPYKVPDNVESKNKINNYRIRWGTSTIKPNPEQERELIELTAKVPFDDRVNSRFEVGDLDFGLMREHLSKTNSRLFQESANLSLDELSERMNLCVGSSEHLFPKNVGLLMFSNDPAKFFPHAVIDVVHFPAGLAGEELEEVPFRGAIQKQLSDVLSYLQKNVVRTITIKSNEKAEVDNISNYPYAALEEAIPNAVYHRNYEVLEPTEIRIFPEKIEIISYSGVVPSLSQSDFDSGSVRARRYRNRRIGEFLKELDLTEGRSTGIPRMQRAMKLNGSPSIVFDVDDPNRGYFITEIPIHPSFLSLIKEDIASEHATIMQVVGFNQLTKRQKEVLELIMQDNKISYNSMKEALGISTNRGLSKHVERLKEVGAISRIGSTREGNWKVHF